MRQNIRLISINGETATVELVTQKQNEAYVTTDTFDLTIGEVIHTFFDTPLYKAIDKSHRKFDAIQE